MTLRLSTSDDRGPKYVVQIVDRQKLGRKRKLRTRTGRSERPTANFSVTGCSSVQAARREFIALINKSGSPFPHEEIDTTKLGT